MPFLLLGPAWPGRGPHGPYLKHLCTYWPSGASVSPWQRTDGDCVPDSALPQGCGQREDTAQHPQPLAVPAWSQITNTLEVWCPREGPFSGLPWRPSWLVLIHYLFLTLQMVSKQPFDFKSLQKIPKSHSKGDTSLYLLPFKIYTHWVPREGF